MKAGSVGVAPASASVTAAATARARAAGSSTMTQPPNPPPVIRAPSAPAASAASTAVSAAGQDTSKSSRSDTCDWVSNLPHSAIWPARRSAATRFYSPVLGDHVPGAADEDGVRKPAERGRVGDVAERVSAKQPGGLLALQPTRRVPAVSKFVPDAGVDHQEPQAVLAGIERNRSRFSAAAVEQQGMAGLAQHGG